MLKTTEELIAASKTGDQSAFTELVARYERAAWVAAWRVLREHHATLDATQNAFVAAWCNLSDLRSPAQFGVWLMRIAQREATRIARRSYETQSLETQSLEVAGQLATPAVTDRSPNDDALMTAVSNLPEHERLVTVLRYFNGHSVDEVARLTGRPVGTVTKQLSRALARLKSILRSSTHAFR